MRGFFQSIISSNKPETWVFMVAGQSNILHQTEEIGTETYPVGSLQWGRDGGDNNTLIPAAVPLQHHGYPNVLNGAGLVTRFSNKIKNRYPNVTLVFIPSAEGSSSFAANQWNKGDSLYEDLITRTNLCLSENPDFKLKGFLWLQGISDALANNTNYESQFRQFGLDWRSDVTEANEKTSFVCGGLVPAFIDSSAIALEINNIIKDTPNVVSYTGFADSEVPTVLPELNPRHYSLSSSLILGDRYYEAYLNSLTNN